MTTINTKTKAAASADETLKRFNELTTIQRIDLIVSGVDAVVTNMSETASLRAEATESDSNQLAALATVLKDYAEPVTEEFWDKVLKPSVSEHLSGVRINGSLRYASTGSRDVMVNLFKVATMGLTLMRHEHAFAPSEKASKNLKKYANEVRPLLQKAIDPETTKPRLRSIAQPLQPKTKKVLTGERKYWLVGCEDARLGLAGANTVICGDSRMFVIESKAAQVADKFPRFIVFTSEPEPLDSGVRVVDVPSITNAAVFGQTVSAA